MKIRSLCIGLASLASSAAVLGTVPGQAADTKPYTI
jgi:hypothetical protein